MRAVLPHMMHQPLPSTGDRPAAGVAALSRTLCPFRFVFCVTSFTGTRVYRRLCLPRPRRRVSGTTTTSTHLSNRRTCARPVLRVLLPCVFVCRLYFPSWLLFPVFSLSFSHSVCLLQCQLARVRARHALQPPRSLGVRYPAALCPRLLFRFVCAVLSFTLFNERLFISFRIFLASIFHAPLSDPVSPLQRPP
jgi:hypothetical protein